MTGYMKKFSLFLGRLKGLGMIFASLSLSLFLFNLLILFIIYADAPFDGRASLFFDRAGLAAGAGR